MLYDDPDNRDKFFRFQESLQEFFDLASAAGCRTTSSNWDSTGPHPNPLPLTQEREKAVCKVRLRTVSLPRLYGSRSAPCDLFCVFSLSLWERARVREPRWHSRVVTNPRPDPL